MLVYIIELSNRRRYYKNDDKRASFVIASGLITLIIAVVRLLIGLDETLSALTSSLFIVFTCIVVYTVDHQVSKLIFSSALIAVCPFLIYWIIMHSFGNAGYWGNRWGLLFTYAGIIFMYLTAAKRVSAFNLGIVIFLYLVVFMTGSRTSLVAYTLAIIIYLFSHIVYKTLGIKIMMTLLIGVICIAVSIIFRETILRMLFSKWGQANSYASTEARFEIWEYIFSSKSFFGIQSDAIIARYGVTNAHNSYVQAYAMFGWPGIISYIIVVICCVINVFAKNTYFKVRDITFLLPFLFLSIMESNYIFDPEYCIFGILFIVFVGQVSKRTEEELPRKNKTNYKILAHMTRKTYVGHNL
jgi:O-antigen ligase